ncbi:hypothetical protein DRQ53_01320 [bacterium]|nr:MAG: hypothetical protein DRQ53_01320 [bacterium]
MVTLRILFALTIALSFLALTGCDDDNSERARNAITVSAVNEGGVYVSATWDAGQNKEFPDLAGSQADDFQPFAHMPMMIKNRPYNEFVTNPNYSPFGDFRITNVEVEWIRVASGDQARLAELQTYNFTAGYDISVPSGSEVIFNVLMLPFYAKGEAPLINMTGAYGGNNSVPSFVAVAAITLTGHDSGSTDDIMVVSEIMVEFVGLIVESN